MSPIARCSGREQPRAEREDSRRRRLERRPDQHRRLEQRGRIQGTGVGIKVEEHAMTYTSIRDLTRQKPFHPFVLQTSTGETYTVRHVEGFLLATDHIIIGLLKNEAGQDYDRTVYIDLA